MQNQNSLLQVNQNNTSTSSLPSDSNNNKNIPTLKLGEKTVYNDIEVCINKVENSGNKIKVYFTVKNNSQNTLDSRGGFDFKLIDPKYEDELNNSGYGMSPSSGSQYVYPKESYNGYYEWSFERNVDIKEISYRLMYSGSKKDTVGIWILK
ncbi:MAG: hypothetical protein ACREVX_11570 [Clostridium sp.]|uniref:hypothetical protein n=1 Tax=Clostridium sp. TaxID=1506 RepID=UPI003D6D2BE2